MPRPTYREQIRGVLRDAGYQYTIQAPQDTSPCPQRFRGFIGGRTGPWHPCTLHSGHAVDCVFSLRTET